MFTIITDSCCDLNPEIANQYERLEIVPLSYTMSGETHANALYDTKTVKPYYDRLRSGEMSTTSQINPAMWQEVFEAHVKKGKQLLCLIFSSALSGTYGAACVARDMVLESAPDAVIEIVDTLSASAGQGLMVCDALDNRNAGMDIHENAEWIRAHRQNYVHWFTVDDLHFLKRGGRISGATAVVGSILQIKPVLHVDNEGHLINVSKARGRKASIQALAAKVGQTAIEPEKQTMFISHGDCLDDAEYLANLVKEQYGVKTVHINHVGPVIGSPSGPGTLALFFLATER